MPTISVDGNEYEVSIFETGDDANLQDGLQLVIAEDDGEQRASIWEIPGTDKHVINLQRGEPIPGDFDADLEFEVTGSDAEALRRFLIDFPELSEISEYDYVVIGDNPDLGATISRLVNEVDSREDGRAGDVLSKMIATIADLGERVDGLEVGEEVLDTDLMKAESIIGHAKISKSVSLLEQKIEDREDEQEFQDFFEENPWFFGTKFVKSVDRDLLPRVEFDFALKSINGYLDIIELKRPDDDLLRYDDSHENWVPRADLVTAVTQLQNYMRQSERLQDYVYREENVQVLKPRGIVVMGSNLDEEERKGLRLAESHLNRVDIVTYTELLDRGRRMKRFYEA